MSDTQKNHENAGKLEIIIDIFKQDAFLEEGHFIIKTLREIQKDIREERDTFIISEQRGVPNPSVLQDSLSVCRMVDSSGNVTVFDRDDGEA